MKLNVATSLVLDGRADSKMRVNPIQVNVYVECHQSLYLKNATGPALIL